MSESQDVNLIPRTLTLDEAIENADQPRTLAAAIERRRQELIVGEELPLRYRKPSPQPKPSSTESGT